MHSERQYIDIESGLARVRGNKTLYGRMLGMFLNGGECAALEENLSAQDYFAAANTAHAIKGIAGNLSLTALFDISATLTEHLRQGEPDEQEVADFRSICAATRQVVEQTIADLA